VRALSANLATRIARSRIRAAGSTPPALLHPLSPCVSPVCCSALDAGELNSTPHAAATYGTYGMGWRT